MWFRVKDIWEHNRLALLAFATMLCLAGFFGFKALSQYIYWADPRHQDQALAAWMTPRYIARSYSVPPEVIQTALQLDLAAPPRRISLETLAAERGITLAILQEQIDTAVSVWRSANPKAQP